MIVIHSCGNMFTGWVLCIIFSVVAGKGLLTKGWDTGSSHKYTFSTTVLFREVGSTKLGGDVGFRLTGSTQVSAIWRDPADYDRVLLKFDLLRPQLWIKSRKAPEPEGFVEHSSRVDESTSHPALALWRHGEVQEIYLHQAESVSSANLKRGLISLFYYRTLDGEIREQDASGWCNVSYSSLGPRHIVKRKYLCDGDHLPLEKHNKPILDVDVVSTRDSTYELSYNLMPKTINEEERHEMTLKSRPEVGATVSSRRTLEEITGGVGKSEVIDDSSLEEAIDRYYSKYKKSGLQLQPEPASCPESGCQSMEELIEENQDALNNTAIGTVKSALAFLKILPLVKETSKIEDLVKILKSPRNKPLRIQLVDIFGAASTPVAHQAAMKILRQDETGNEMERYLWSLSLSPKPHATIIQDVLDRSEEVLQNDKVSETLALTAAAMANHHGSPTIVESARISLTKGLESCTGDECRMKFLRALRNLKSQKSVPTLLHHAIDGTKLVSLTAWRALSTLPRAYIDDKVKNTAKRVFFQLGGQKRDSSVRTMALNILLETCSCKEDLQDLVYYFASFDSAYEVRKYLGQRMDQLSEKNPAFSKYLKQAFRDASRKINNYNVFAQKGLSTAFGRKFLESRGSNGSLITIQEVNGGLLKRGVVDVVLETNDHEEVVFSLGLFAGGLSSFVSSDQDNEIDDEVATAGMEIDLLGVGVRPFTFFTGQGELMSHVWSGTASERTPAFQLLSSLHNHKQMIPLASGFIADIGLQGALSFDLAGQIQLSLWSRNAQSLVDLAAGIAVLGSIKTRSSFVQSQADFSLTLEPKLELATDVDFAGNVALCMRLSQPETIIKYQVYKVERIPGSRHKLRKTRRSKFLSPARSYLLNKKNNEMCSKVFN